MIIFKIDGSRLHCKRYVTVSEFFSLFNFKREQ